ncbi:coiled-coil domain-containing protein 106 [Esox lucius]|uniref:coiled-coil domain-containing protein 106 n=1 Tax=Esox lucius TaxID=8010 RepID=UPI001476F03E|nr:coiled-coil domain-containing protein 106 [Esox lucius]
MEVNKFNHNRPQTRQKKRGLEDLAENAGTQAEAAPTFHAVLAKSKAEVELWKLKAHNLQEKVQDLTNERDFLRAQLAGTKNTESSFLTDSKKESTVKESESSSDSDSSDSSESSNSDSSSEDRKKKKKYSKKGRKEKKRKKKSMKGKDAGSSRQRELAIAAPNKYSTLLEAHGKDKLAVFANRCKKAVDEDAEILAAVKNMKTDRKLLPNKTNN